MHLCALCRSLCLSFYAISCCSSANWHKYDIIVELHATDWMRTTTISEGHRIAHRCCKVQLFRLRNTESICQFNNFATEKDRCKSHFKIIGLIYNIAHMLMCRKRSQLFDIDTIIDERAMLILFFANRSSLHIILLPPPPPFILFLCSELINCILKLATKLLNNKTRMVGKNK